jgi:cytochrome c553
LSAILEATVMHIRTWVVLVAITGALTVGLESQQPAGAQSAPLPAPVPREPSWAFQVQAGSLPPESPEPKTVPGSTRKYTPKEIDDIANPPDWFPDEHPPAPEVIVKGRPGLPACGSCHLMSGFGHPESADLTGQTAAYFVQQMQDFRSGARQDWAARMNAYAKALTDEEIQQAADYFAALPRQPFVRVVEAEMVPKTFVGQGRMRFVDPAAKGEMEPIGNRIITLPEDQDRARLRDPKSGFVAYVPPGSLERGKTLVETGGGRTIPCAMCHGERLEGMFDFPRLAGVHPIYTARQLYHFKEGTRKGPNSAAMTGTVVALTDQDIVDISAYAASLPPE